MTMFNGKIYYKSQFQKAKNHGYPLVNVYKQLWKDQIHHF